MKVVKVKIMIDSLMIIVTTEYPPQNRMRLKGLNPPLIIC